MMNNRCSCNKSTEPPPPTGHFTLEKGLSNEELYAHYKYLLDEYRELRTMYANASDAYDSMEQSRDTSLNNMNDYKDEFIKERRIHERL